MHAAKRDEDKRSMSRSYTTAAKDAVSDADAECDKDRTLIPLEDPLEGSGGCYSRGL